MLNTYRQFVTPLQGNANQNSRNRTASISINSGTAQLTTNKNLVTFTKVRDEARDLTEERIRAAITSNTDFMNKIERHPERLVPEDIMQIGERLNLKMTKYKGREALMFACELQTKLELFKLDRLVAWFVKSIESYNLRGRRASYEPSIPVSHKSDEESFMDTLN